MTLRLSDCTFKEAPRTLNTYNSNLTLPRMHRNMGYGSELMHKTTQELRAGGLRFPGGTISNNYLWEEDSFALQPDDKTKWAARVLKQFRESGKTYDLEGWVNLCAANEMIPFYSLNIYQETPESVVRLLDTIKAYGGDLKHIELGTETYWDPRSHNDVQAYIRYCKPLAAAIKSYDPEIQIGANFGPFDRPGNYETIWNAVLAKEDFYDAVVHHEYYGGQGIAVDAGSEADLQQVLYPDGFISHLIEKSRKHDRKDLPIWITEWNMGVKGLKTWKGTGAQLLFMGAALQEIIRESEEAPFVTYHQIYQELFGTFALGEKEGEVTYFPTYWMMKLFGEFWDGAETVAVPDEEKQKGASPLLSVVRKKNSTEIFLVNRTDKPFTLSLPEFMGKSATLHHIDCSKLTEQLPVSTNLILEKPVNELDAVSIPAYSICRLVLN